MALRHRRGPPEAPGVLSAQELTTAITPPPGPGARMTCRSPFSYLTPTIAVTLQSDQRRPDNFG